MGTVQKVLLCGELPIKCKTFCSETRAIISDLEAELLPAERENNLPERLEITDSQFKVLIMYPEGGEEEITAGQGSPILDWLFGANWESKIDQLDGQD